MSIVIKKPHKTPVAGTVNEMQSTTQEAAVKREPSAALYDRQVPLIVTQLFIPLLRRSFNIEATR